MGEQSEPTHVGCHRVRFGRQIGSPSSRTLSVRPVAGCLARQSPGLRWRNKVELPLLTASVTSSHITNIQPLHKAVTSLPLRDRSSRPAGVRFEALYLHQRFVCGSFAAITDMKRTCATCNSENVSTENLSRPGPSLFYTLLFGWLFLLCRLAFVPRRGICRDCGATIRYRTIGSYIAMAFVALLVVLIVWGLIAALRNPGSLENDY